MDPRRYVQGPVVISDDENDGTHNDDSDSGDVVGLQDGDFMEVEHDPEEEEGWLELLERLRNNDPAVTVVDRDTVDGDHGMDHTKAEELAAALHGNDVVDFLLLNTQDMGPTGARALAAFVRDRRSALETLLVSWSEDHEEQEVFRILLDAAGDSPSLKELQLSYCVLGYLGEAQERTALATVLGKTRTIRSLTLSECGFDPEGNSPRPVGPTDLGFRDNSTLETVTVLGEDSERSLLRNLLPGLLGHQTLKHLQLRDCWSPTLQLTLERCPALETLHLLWCNLSGVGGYTALADCLARRGSLRTLMIRDGWIASQDCYAVGAFLKQQEQQRDETNRGTRLTGLILSSDMGFCPTGMANLTAGLYENVSLETLELPQTRLEGIEEVALIQDLLQHNRQLTSLNLEGNRFGPEGARVLSAGGSLQRLRSLNVSCCNLGDEGVHLLCDGLAARDGGHSLRMLLLDSNRITFSGLCSVMGLFGGGGRRNDTCGGGIHHVRLDGNPITRAGERARSGGETMPAGEALGCVLRRQAGRRGALAETPLRELELQRCGLNGADLSCLFLSLQENTALKTLQLDGNLALDETALVQLANCLPGICGLENLSFTWPSAYGGGSSCVGAVSAGVLNGLLVGLKRNHSLHVLETDDKLDKWPLYPSWSLERDFYLARNRLVRWMVGLLPSPSSSGMSPPRASRNRPEVASTPTSWLLWHKVFPQALVRTTAAHRFPHQRTRHPVVRLSLTFHLLHEKLPEILTLQQCMKKRRRGV